MKKFHHRKKLVMQSASNTFDLIGHFKKHSSLLRQLLHSKRDHCVVSRRKGGPECPPPFTNQVSKIGGGREF